MVFVLAPSCLLYFTNFGFLQPVSVAIDRGMEMVETLCSYWVHEGKCLSQKTRGSELVLCASSWKGFCTSHHLIRLREPLWTSKPLDITHFRAHWISWSAWISCPNWFACILWWVLWKCLLSWCSGVSYFLVPQPLKADKTVNRHSFLGGVFTSYVQVAVEFPNGTNRSFLGRDLNCRCAAQQDVVLK